MLVGLVLTEISASRKRQESYLQQEESYQVAKMALQTGADHLTLNGQDVTISKNEKSLVISQKGETLVSISEQ